MGRLNDVDLWKMCKRGCCSFRAVNRWLREKEVG